ncbi:DUF1244 domain-containing protein [Sphingomonas sp. Leaf25]|uniref:DUF1244 domain-containing protein n=1 Tax=Sphingomonas sp. Leaf25 TaxID=1735692 RepID=UPI0006F9CCC3|nr:DUF1244 domain-containing protein [Sphingomonas sp. Leaf25]KQN06479.1 hypothetical protein ASE78_16155 [Sphingomonas sp. Leaf25]
MATIDFIDEAAQAAAFRRLVRHLQHRTDAQNVDLMGLAGFCRNCLGDWLGEAAGVSKDEGREAVYGMPYATWKADHQQPASDEQIARMKASVARNEALDNSVPASDPPAISPPK